MKAAVRFAEYSLTGGFFWLNVFLLLTLLHLDAGHGTWTGALLDLWSGWLRRLDEALGRAGGLEALITALTLLVVFATGLLLDLLAPIFFAPFEVAAFRRFFRDPRQTWMDELTRRQGDHLHHDLEDFLREPVFSWRDPRLAGRQRHRYERLRAFLLVHLYTHAAGTRLDELLDQLRLVRTSRALSLSLALLALFLATLVGLAEEGSFASRYAEAAAILIPLGLFFLSVAITRATFQRLCLLLSAFAHHVCRNEND